MTGRTQIGLKIAISREWDQGANGGCLLFSYITVGKLQSMGLIWPTNGFYK